jgi:hypothetical protein
MKRIGLIFSGLISGIVLMMVVLWTGAIGSAAAVQGQPSGSAATASPSDEGNAPWQIQAISGTDETPPPGLDAGGLAPNALPTPVPGESQLYFVPSDNDASATVLTLYNTDSVAHIVALRGFSYNGVLVYSLNINVPATGFLRLVSDSVAAAPPPSWATPAPIITNFTDFTYYASLSLPKGVKVEGYILFNPGTGVVNPRLDQGAIPLRFSTDPATVFLPLNR